jgi:putative ABC transport system substrate-binding protein
VLAQQLRRVGFLSSLAAETQQANLAAFHSGLKEAGFVEGRNLIIEYRWASGDYARLPELAAELARSHVEAIACGGGAEPGRAAMAATKTIPIVSASNGPDDAPLVKQFNRPEANLTAVNIITPNPKRLQILAEIVPSTTIGVLMNPTSPQYNINRTAIEEGAAKLGIKLAFAAASADGEFDAALANLARQHVSALLVISDPFFASRWQPLVDLAASYALPASLEWRESVVAGGLMTYGPQLSWVHQQTGRYTGQILNGAKPADLPVVVPTKFDLIINLKTARAFGLTVPQALLANAEEVLE